MATTRLINIHISRSSNAARCFKARIDYIMNPAKNENGRLVSAYNCDPKTAANEFLLSRQTYLSLTGRHRSDEVIAYQLRQSFAPGEITPDEANKVGRVLAERFLKGNHAFIVSTHTDKAHIHNHIIFCATALDCKHKFRNFLGSGRALAKLSDQICYENHLSVVQEPHKRDSNYDKWLGDNVKLTNRDRLRLSIDEMLKKNPDGFEALMSLLEDAGWRIKRGKQISFKAPDSPRYMRMDTLGEEYSEQRLREVLSGNSVHIEQSTRRMKKVSLLIDIQSKIDQGKGEGFKKWAQTFNIKQMAGSLAYLSDNNIRSYEELTERVNSAVQLNDSLLSEIKNAETTLKQITELKKTIYDYLKTKNVFAEWKKTGWSSDFYSLHEQELLMHKSAKKTFDNYQGKLPTIKELTAEYAEVLSRKQKAYSKYRAARDNMRELLTVRANIDIVTEKNNEEKGNRRCNIR